MTIQHLNIITYTQTALSVLVAVLAFIHFNRRHTYVKLIGLAFLLGFIANSLSLLMFYSGSGRYTNIPQSMYGILNFGVVSLIYYHALKKLYADWFKVIFVFFIIFAIYNFLFWQGPTMLNSYTDSLSSFLIMCFSIFYFYMLMVELPVVFVYRLPMFWFNAAYLFYRAGSMILFVFTSYLVNVIQDNMIIFWFFHNSLSIVEHGLVLTGLWQDLRQFKIQMLFNKNQRTSNGHEAKN